VAVLDKGEIVEIGQVSTIFTEPKHQITKYFLQNTIHDLPQDFLKNLNQRQLMLRLSFKGNSAKNPIISDLIKNYNVSINILQGWIDNVQETIIGSLTIELSGDETAKKDALEFLRKSDISYEVL
jgi:D-methionine transport system ATP-binding protein